ncbi:MAG: PqqD family protein [Xanthomonadales bacterium]|nr:PqqD family protein [Xanthomonadales bacterium]
MSFRVPDHVLEENIGNDVVLLSLQSETFYSLNEAGIQLWATIKGGGDAPVLEQLLIDTYGIGATQARADVEAFLGELLRLMLIEES